MVRRQAFIWISVVSLVLLALFFRPPGFDKLDTDVQVLTCPDELSGFLDCFKQRMPRTLNQDHGRSALPVRPPTPDQQAALLRAAQALYAVASSESPSCAISLPDKIARWYTVSSLTAPGQSYCALWEGQRGVQEMGWGALIVNRQPTRRLIFGVPHPLSDMHTLDQAKDLLVDLGGLALVVAGAHRRALPALPVCTSWNYPKSDASHHATGYFSLGRSLAGPPSVIGQPWWFIELHGMRAASAGDACFDTTSDRPMNVYLSTGVSPATSRAFKDDFAVRLAREMDDQHPTWVVKSTADTLPCNKIGSANLLGRYLNGGRPRINTAECSSMWRAPTSSTGRFVHIEQTACIQGDDCASKGQRIRRAQAWADAISTVYEGLAES